MPELTHEQRVEMAQRRVNESELDQSEKALSYPVRKSNELIQRSRYELSLHEQRLLNYLISKIQKNDNGSKRYKIKIREACKIIGLEADGEEISGAIYASVYKCFSALRDKGFDIYTERGTKVRCGWLEHPEQNQDGEMEYNYDPRVIPYLFHIQKRFTQYQLNTIMEMRSSYGICLYELLKSYANIKRKTFTVDELRERMGATSKAYNHYGVFKQKVIDRAMKDLEFSDLKVSYIENKVARKVVSLEFIITDISGSVEYYERQGMNFDDDE